MKTTAVESAERRLDQARNALAAARAHQEKCAGTETEAAASADAYAEWLRQWRLSNVEVDRIGKLIELHETELATEREKAAKEEQARLEADFERDAKTTAKLIQDNLAAMTNLARETIRAIGISEQQRIAAQSGRASGLPTLQSAEHRVRCTPGMQRQDIGDEIVRRWVFVETGNVITDEGQASHVISEDDQKGIIPSGSRFGTGARVEKRSFRKVSYHLPEQRQYSTKLANALRVPGLRPDQPPGWEGGSRHFPEGRHLIAELDRLTGMEKTELQRAVHEELIPCDARALEAIASKVERR